MTRECRQNAAQTTILTPCPLHEAWRRQREREGLEKLYALFEAGDAAIDAAVKAARKKEAIAR